MDDHRIKNIVKSISNINSDSFFDEICLSIGLAIGADFVYVAMIDSEKSNANTISVAKKGQIVEGFSYKLLSTPCDDVANKNICSHSCNIQQLYPNDKLLVDMGIDGYVGVPLKNNEGKIHAILVVLFEQKICDVNEVETLCLLFSGLIEKELHKKSYLKKIEFTSHILQNTHEAIMVCDKDKFITFVNPSFTRMTGYEASELAGKTPKVLSSGKQTGDFYKAMWSDINNKGHWQGEIWNKRKDGMEYLEWLSITAVKNVKDELNHYIAFFTDITEQFLSNEKVKYQESHDSLTQIANKDSLFDFIEYSQRLNPNKFKIAPTAALLVIDIDLFKRFNSLYNHAFGDKVLIYVADTLQKLVRNSDIVARTSGDTFSIFVNYLTSENAIIPIIDNITQAFSSPFVIDGVSIKITFSIGISFLYKDAQNAHALFETAEQAMFSVKDYGYNSYGFYSQVLSEKANKEEKLKLALERAIENDELGAVYQPIVSLNSPKITKFEVLVRWNHNGSLISPVEFIPIAEKFGLITKIGDIVLNKACRELKNLEKLGYTDLVFNVNRSIYEFSSNITEISWLNIIKKHELKPENICFELTESVLAPENESYIDILNQLQLAGCSIALDDFGTGYSSLSYLRRFPINTLKIDRSFITDMTKKEGDVVLVSAIISMAKALGINVVAEGVELKQEVEILTKLGCDFIQGYYFSKPLSPELIPQYISDYSNLLKQ
jgi:diguanylate cyclase (GGDEF)-like protein/PAS domain S-box-containing protein